MNANMIENILNLYKKDGLSLGDAVTKIQNLTKTKKQIPLNIVEKFEKIWAIYPKRVGRKEALRHFAATVKTDQDYADIHKALENYKRTKNVIEGNLSYIQNGSTWFNNWRDWLNASWQNTKKEPESAIARLKENNLT
jgi:hypothetical protein